LSDGFVRGVAIGPVGACACDCVNKDGRLVAAGTEMDGACESWPKPPKPPRPTEAGVLVGTLVLMPKFPNKLFEVAGVAGLTIELPKEKAGVEAVSPCVVRPLGPFDCAPNANPGVLVPKSVEPPAKGVEGAWEFAPN
jgi:hypothetical protein